MDVLAPGVVRAANVSRPAEKIAHTGEEAAEKASACVSSDGDEKNEAAEAGPAIMPEPASMEGIPSPLACAEAETSTAAFSYPQGLRKMHANLNSNPKAEILMKKVRRKTQDFVNQLFDMRQVSTINFKDFRKAWEEIGGGVEGAKSGGSHRHLIAPDGTPLWGTYDHGGFGLKTIKYLQAAFYWAGYRSSI